MLGTICEPENGPRFGRARNESYRHRQRIEIVEKRSALFLEVNTINTGQITQRKSP